MPKLRVLLIRPLTRIAVRCLVISLFAFPATAQRNNTSYMFLLASGFLCDPGDSSTCPARAKANQGDSYEVSGAGTFDVQNKSVKAAGTFTHRFPDGNKLETGVWLASELLSFESYGVAPAALPHKGWAFGAAPFVPGHLPMSSGYTPTGGLALFRIHLLPLSGASTNAVLQVNCTLGDVPHERSVEGIRLTLERSGSDFSEEASGRVMFLSMRPEVSAPAKTRQQEPAAEPTESPSN